jgi:hypothetical protein
VATAGRPCESLGVTCPAGCADHAGRKDRVTRGPSEANRTMVNQEEMLGVLLAYSSTWQALTGAGRRLEALANVKQGQADDGADNPSAIRGP